MVSRQALWQRKMKDEGRCITCGVGFTLTPRTYKTPEKQVKASRDRYRRAHGIPLNSPATHNLRCPVCREKLNANSRAYYARKENNANNQEA